jgi:hypothetical protein
MLKKTIEEILKENTNKWMKIPGVVGTALGIFNNKPCIKIFVTELSPQIQNQIPKQVKNHLIVVEETGLFLNKD